MLACGIILLGVVTTVIIHFVTGIPMSTMVGILSGAVTNTPGLGAAQQAYSDMYGVSDNTIATGYTVAYATLGVGESVMASAATKPGVLVMPPVITPSRSKMLILNTKYPKITATTIGTSVIATPTKKSAQPLS